MTTLKIVRPHSAAERVTGTTVDTIAFTVKEARAWLLPGFQRPLRVNDKVRAAAKQIKEDGGVLPGMITLGVVAGKTYLADGQHRREAFFISGCETGYADVRYVHATSVEALGKEFAELNSSLVSMRPDDVLRGLEHEFGPLAYIRKCAPYVGYDQIRRGGNSPVLSMSALLRCWNGSSNEVPRTGGLSARDLGEMLTLEEAEAMTEYLGCAFKAWGRDAACNRLWGNLNLAITMWLYRRTVIAPYSTKTPKLTRDMFTKCLMSLSADSTYVDYLMGRSLTDRDRAPAYNKVKALFAKRLEAETGSKVMLPQPAWCRG